MKKVLLLGGTGTIGQYITEICKNDGDVEVFVTSRNNHIQEGNIHYIKGNAHDDLFLETLCNEVQYDAIIDFMSYKTEEFKGRVEKLLSYTKHYIFISSSRVYGDSHGQPICEDNKRLLEVSQDKKYLATDEYALTKARQEDVLKKSNYRNWTIVRPYITFGKDRLQLGIYEKEQWLYRALQGKPIVFPKDIEGKFTTLTPNKEVAMFLYNLIGRGAEGEIYHVTSGKSLKWSTVLNVYLHAIKETTGRKVEVVFSSRPVIQEGSRYQYYYDRCYDRFFDNTKAQSIYYNQNLIVEKELEESVRDFIMQSKKFKSINWRMEGRMDRISSSFQNLNTIPSMINRIKYLFSRIGLL